MPFETFLGRLKVKVTGVKLRSKWPYIELVRAITCTFMHGFQNSFCTVVVLEEEKCYLNFFSGRLKVKVRGVK